MTVTDPVVLQHLARARPTPRSGSFIRHGFTSRLEGTSKLSARVAWPVPQPLSRLVQVGRRQTSLWSGVVVPGSSHICPTTPSGRDVPEWPVQHVAQSAVLTLSAVLTFYRGRMFRWTYSNHESSPLSSRRWTSQKTQSPVSTCS